jgi:hypothetical protein
VQEPCRSPIETGINRRPTTDTGSQSPDEMHAPQSLAPQTIELEHLFVSQYVPPYGDIASAASLFIPSLLTDVIFLYYIDIVLCSQRFLHVDVSKTFTVSQQIEQFIRREF